MRVCLVPVRTIAIFRFSTFWNATFSAWSWYRLVNSGTRCGEPCARVLEQPGDWDGLLGTGNRRRIILPNCLVLLKIENRCDEQAWFLPCLMQGNTQEELPEFLLGTCRLNYLDASKAVSLDECWPDLSRSRRPQVDPNSLWKHEYSTSKPKRLKLLPVSTRHTLICLPCRPQKCGGFAAAVYIHFSSCK